MDLKKLYSLEGRTVIVTGGRGTYGAGISEGLCEMGAEVIIASRNKAKCEELAASLRDKGYKARGEALDLSADDSVRALAEKVYRDSGRIDVLVNNAVDRSNMVSLENATREKLQASSDTNLTGQIMLTQAVVGYMKKQGGGSIVNIGSMRGLDCPHFPFYPESWGEQPLSYTTEKWAMVGMTKYLAGRYGRDGIRVNCVAPGGFNPGLADDPDKKAFVDTYIRNCPLGRWATADDIKGPVAFLASDASAYITGATLVMDGGWTIW